MPEIEADIAKLRQVILAVLLAAVESMGGTWAKSGPTAKGHLRIAGYLTETGGRYCAHLAIDDTGPVDPSRERATILDSDAVLANRDLAVAAALLDQAGGRLSYEALADGNRIVLELPLAGDPPLPRRPVNPSISAAPLSPASANVDRDRPSGPAFEAEGQTPVALVVHAPAATAGSAAAAASPASPTSPAARPGASLTVLVCDDERSIRALLARVITRGGHHAREASGGAEALAILEAEPVDLVMADQRMADMTGVDLYRAAVARRPELATRFVLMSGNAGTPELMEFATETGLQVIEKPFDLSVVTATLRRLAAG
jgi:CheY-like chemotaxis protein